MKTLVVIGGGIAGITCAESYSKLKPNDKSVCNVQKISKVLESFDVYESSYKDVEFSHPNINVVICNVTSIDTKNRIVHTDKDQFYYDYLSICSGAKPNIIKESPYIIGIRDTETIINLKNKLKGAKRVVLIGNGGIALELVNEIKSCQIVWSIKDKHIGNAFFDQESADFLFHSKKILEIEKQNVDNDNIQNQQQQQQPQLKHQFEISTGSALGPQWYQKYNIENEEQKSNIPHQKQVYQTIIEYSTHLENIYDQKDEIKEKGIKEENIDVNSRELFSSGDKEIDWPIYVKLSNGHIYGCDFVISATGVIPNSSLLLNSVEPTTEVKVMELDGLGGKALVVDENMMTSIPRIYAAGDVCHLPWSTSPFWFQMRLWSQARIMGRFAAQCIAKESVHDQPGVEVDEISTPFEFELFAHVTKFFGFKVIMLGLYNGQTLDLSNENIKIYKRAELGEEFVRIILKDGKLQGALLIGDTDLEETFENLILNQIDLSTFGEDILNPDIDIEDYFD
eukprot:gene8419-10338_t